jgi:pyruvate dehydrogenase E2 component (dihydrolipoamide acetyltransferase)
MPDLLMPSLGADMTAGRLLEWHVSPGDVVHRGDIVATVDTDKAEIDIETFDDGVVGELVAQPGATVPVGGVLAHLEADAGAPAAPPPPPATPESPHAPAPQPSAVARPDHRARVSPLARRMAADLGVDLATVRGTGPAGAITRADVERVSPVAPAPPAAAPAGRTDGGEHRLERLRNVVGGLMARSKREIPHYQLARDVDLSTALDWLGEHNRERPASERILPAVILLKAAALATRDVPEVNGSFEDGRFTPADHVDLGVAISLRAGGVIAPAIPEADELSLVELMRELRALTGRVRRGVLRGSDVAGATLTVTSLGEHGADLVHGVIFPPQVALVGFGRIAERPYAAGGMLAVRPTVTATLAADHRVSDGHRGSLYLNAVDRLLKEPERL